MTKTRLPLCGLLLAAALISVRNPLSAAPAKARGGRKVQAQISTTRTLRGTIMWRERIAMLPGAKAHLILLAQIPGAADLPVLATVLSTGVGNAPFALIVPANNLLAGTKYRVKAWIVVGGQVVMSGVQTSTPVVSWAKPLNVVVRFVSGSAIGSAPIKAAKPPVNDSEPTPEDTPKSTPMSRPLSKSQYKLRGQIMKFDMHDFAPDAQITVELRDVSKADGTSILLGQTEVELKGRQLPVEYVLDLSGVDLNMRGRYSISARVSEGDSVPYRTDANYSFDPAQKDQWVNLRVVPTK